MELATTVTLAALGVVLLATIRRDVAVLLAAGVTTALNLLVPVSRMEPDILRFVVPLTGLALAAIAAVRTPGWMKWMTLPVAYLSFTGVVALTQSGFLLWLLSAATLISGTVLGTALRSADRVDRFAVVFAWFAAALGVAATLEYALGWPPAWRGAVINADGTSYPLHQVLIAGTRAQATLGHPLPLSTILVLALAVLLLHRTRHQVMRAIGIVAVTAGLIAAGSRNALILAVGLVLFLAARRLTTMRVPAFAAIFVAALVGLVWASETEFTGTGSYTHRIEAMESVTNLLTERSPVEVIFGSTAGGVPELYARGLLQSDGLEAIDNQYVHTFAADGLIGVLMLGAIGVLAFVRATPHGRILIGVLATQGMIFDYLAWPPTALIAWIIFSSALSRTPDPPRGAPAVAAPRWEPRENRVLLVAAPDRAASESRHVLSKAF